MSWIFIASLKQFRIHDFIRDYGFVEYLQKNKVQVGDTVYLYVTAPYKRVEYKMVVERTDISSHDAFDHSPEYREAYRPHYRIVEKGIFESEIKPLLFTKPEENK